MNHLIVTDSGFRKVIGDPKPTRTRGPLPTARELGGTCEVCGFQPEEERQTAPWIERMHLLRGAWKEDDLDLTMLGCGDFGNCHVHARSHATGLARRKAASEMRAVMRAATVAKLIERRGLSWFEDEYPESLEDAA